MRGIRVLIGLDCVVQENGVGLRYEAPIRTENG